MEWGAGIEINTVTEGLKHAPKETEDMSGILRVLIASRPSKKCTRTYRLTCTYIRIYERVCMCVSLKEKPI